MIGDVLQPTHLIFILVVALLVLGPKRLPEVGRSLGRGIRDFRGALSGNDDRSEDSAGGEPRQVDVPPVTPATTTLSADSQPDEDRHVFPADWPPVAEHAKDESEEPEPSSSGTADAQHTGSSDRPVAPVANPFRQD